VVVGVGALIAVAMTTAACGGNGDSESTMPRISGVALMTAPPTTTTTIPDSYVVQEGDTLSAIAARFGLDVGELAAANGIANPDDIRAGDAIAIPSGAAGPSG